MCVRERRMESRVGFSLLLVSLCLLTPATAQCKQLTSVFKTSMEMYQASL